MFLIDIIYTKEMSEVERHTAEHRAWLDEQYKLGTLLCSGPKVPRTGGILLAKLPEKTQAEELIRQDPFYKYQVANYTITEFKMTKTLPQIAEFSE